MKKPKPDIIVLSTITTRQHVGMLLPYRDVVMNGGIVIGMVGFNSTYLYVVPKERAKPIYKCLSTHIHKPMTYGKIKCR